MDATRYLLLILAIPVQQSDSLQKVVTCPRMQRGWKIREKYFDCENADGFTYHCLLDAEGNPVEVCLRRKKYETGGCPWVLEDDKTYYLGKPLTECTNINYCPGGGMDFYSNQLYQYPACFVRTEERHNFTPPNIKYGDSITSDTLQDNRQCDEWQKVALYIHFGVDSMLLIFFAIYMTYRCIVKQRMTRERDIKMDTRYTWELKTLIRDEDKPDKVDKMYERFKRMKDHDYRTKMPIFDGHRVPFLIYAAEYNRRKTVFRLLQRYIEGSHVFNEDIYGRDTHDENIMLIAIRKGWTDVVEQLFEVDDDYFDTDDAFQLAEDLKQKEIHDIFITNRNRRKRSSNSPEKHTH